MKEIITGQVIYVHAFVKATLALMSVTDTQCNYTTIQSNLSTKSAVGYYKNDLCVQVAFVQCVQDTFRLVVVDRKPSTYR